MTNTLNSVTKKKLQFKGEETYSYFFQTEWQFKIYGPELFWLGGQKVIMKPGYLDANLFSHTWGTGNTALHYTWRNKIIENGEH